MTDEEFYDENVAPELLRLAKLCAIRKMSFLAAVDIGDGCGITRKFFPESMSEEMCLINDAAKAKGNIDALCINTAKWARLHNIPHTSIVLSLMGLEPEPSKRAQKDPAEDLKLP